MYVKIKNNTFINFRYVSIAEKYIGIIGKDMLHERCVIGKENVLFLLECKLSKGIQQKNY